MLEGVLYEVISKGENTATVKLLHDSPVYAAHFPGFPITPGVTIVQMALECMGRELSGAKDIKFIVPVPPSAGTLRFEWSIIDDSRADISVFLPGDVLSAKMSVSL